MKTIEINLGFIGHKAEKLQDLFKGYTTTPNENGYFLRFENYNELSCNEGVYIITNCFDTEKDFLETLTTKLLFNL